MKNPIGDLEDKYIELHNLIQTMTYALSTCAEYGQSCDCLVLLQDLIQKKSEQVYNQIEDASIYAYTNISPENKKNN